MHACIFACARARLGGCNKVEMWAGNIELGCVLVVMEM